MKVIAVYNLKGGVGKTTLAVNLAWASATLSSRRTLLWDLDGQAAATYLLGGDARHGQEAQSVFARDVAPDRIIRSTAFDRLDLLPADASLHQLDRFFFTLGKRKRLEKLLERIGKDYDRILLDCPPGLADTSEQVLRAADLIIVPVVPAPLSRRAFDEVVAFLDRHNVRRGAVLPVFNMLDRRRTLHRTAAEQEPDWPIIPMASAMEAMSARREPIGGYAPASAAAQATADLWRAIERRLTRG